MALALVGTVPVSALNIGVAATVPALNSQIAKLQLDLSDLQIALKAQIEIGLNPPTIAGLTLGLSVALSGLTQLLDPTTWVTIGVDANISVALRLGLINLQLSLVGDIVARLEAGLNAGSLAMWTYVGRASGFGETLEKQTVTGFGGLSGDSQIQGIVIATEDPGTWGKLGVSFNTGSTLTSKVNSNTADLRFLGLLSGKEINIGLPPLMQQLRLYLLDLQGLVANLSAQLSVSVGLNLPSLPALTASLQATPPTILFQNLVTIKTDVTAAISGLNLRIQLILNLIAGINAALSGGGLSFWLYSGTTRALGAELRSQLAGGLPGGSGPTTAVYGAVVACGLPSAWADFGLIFKAA